MRVSPFSDYRNALNQGYYGIKKLGGKRKEHWLKPTDQYVYLASSTCYGGDVSLSHKVVTVIGNDKVLNATGVEQTRCEMAAVPDWSTGP